MPGMVIRSSASLVVLLVLYYVVPVGLLPSAEAAVGSVAAMMAAVITLAVLIVGQLRRHLRSGGAEVVRVEILVLLAYLAVVVFALGYFAVATSDEAQFAGLETRTDALYFTMITLSTVGFGDVHPAGQLARALVTAQIAFNLVFVGLLVSLLTNVVRHRVAAVRGDTESS